MNEIVTYVSIIECDNCYNPIFTPLGCPSRSYGSFSLYKIKVNIFHRIFPINRVITCITCPNHLIKFYPVLDILGHLGYYESR